MFTNKEIKNMMTSARIAWRAVETNDVAALSASVPKTQLAETVAALDEAAKAFAMLSQVCSAGGEIMQQAMVRSRLRLVR
jgi:hypothetical protein